MNLETRGLPKTWSSVICATAVSFVFCALTGCVTNERDIVFSCDACPSVRPACDDTTMPPRCVECTAANKTICTGATSFCDDASNTCVGCAGNLDCATSTAPRCDAETGECVACVGDMDCVGLDGLGVCDTNTGECVACTTQNETACRANACNPETLACTTVPRGSVGNCDPCTADSECGDALGAESDIHRCIALTFGGEPQGGRCLKVRGEDVPVCADTFFVPITRISVSGAEPVTYCGINEAVTTCEAVKAGRGIRPCTDAATDCAPLGARCEVFGETVPGTFCTAACEQSSECPPEKQLCTPAGFCDAIQ